MAPAHPSWPGQAARQMPSQQSLHVLKGPYRRAFSFCPLVLSFQSQIAVCLGKAKDPWPSVPGCVTLAKACEPELPQLKR